jgi:hypothetical protein
MTCKSQFQYGRFNRASDRPSDTRVRRLYAIQSSHKTVVWGQKDQLTQYCFSCRTIVSLTMKWREVEELGLSTIRPKSTAAKVRGDGATAHYLTALTNT